MAVEQLQLLAGLQSDVDGECEAGRGAGGYAVAGVGATRLTPNASGLSAETKPSVNLGFGYMVPIVPGLGLRFEVRGYATWIDSTGGLFCRSTTGCAVSIKGNAFYQGEGLIGLTARF